MMLRYERELCEERVEVNRRGSFGCGDVDVRVERDVEEMAV